MKADPSFNLRHFWPMKSFKRLDFREKRIDFSRFLTPYIVLLYNILIASFFLWFFAVICQERNGQRLEKLCNIEGQPLRKKVELQTKSLTFAMVKQKFGFLLLRRSLEPFFHSFYFNSFVCSGKDFRLYNFSPKRSSKNHVVKIFAPSSRHTKKAFIYLQYECLFGMSRGGGQKHPKNL